MFGPTGVLTETELHRATAAGLDMPDSWGIFPRVAIQLFNMKDIASFQVSVVEVYQNRAFDLLDHHKVLTVGGGGRMKGTDPRGDGKCHASGCSCKDCFNEKKETIRGTPDVVVAFRQMVHSAEDIATLARTVEISRISKGHLLNDRSSRSHCLVQIYVSLNKGGKVLTPSFLFVDLAGSERIKKSGVTGVASKEATLINSSLTILGRVIQALAKNVGHVPYRDSTLTMLLQPVFANRACASVMVNVASEAAHVEETIVSLQFAKRLTHVKLTETRVEGYDFDTQKMNLQLKLSTATAKLKLMEGKHMGGHFGTNAVSSHKNTFQENFIKLEMADACVSKVQAQLNEATSWKPNSAACRRLSEKLQKTIADRELIKGVVEREKTIKGLWIEPTLAYTKTQADVRHLESLLAIHIPKPKLKNT